MPEKKWIDAMEMSSELGVPPRTCQRWLKENHAGLFPSAKKIRPSRNSKYIVLFVEVQQAKSQLATDADF